MGIFITLGVVFLGVIFLPNNKVYAQTKEYSLLTQLGDTTSETVPSDIKKPVIKGITLSKELPQEKGTTINI